MGTAEKKREENEEDKPGRWDEEKEKEWGSLVI
jgi:hypothetical protein